MTDVLMTRWSCSASRGSRRRSIRRRSNRCQPADAARVCRRGPARRAGDVDEVQRGRGRRRHGGGAGDPAAAVPEARSLQSHGRRRWSSSLAAAAGFVAGTPYSILDAPAFVADFRYDLTHLSAAHGVDVGPGWYAHLTRSLPYGCGVAIFAGGRRRAGAGRPSVTAARSRARRFRGGVPGGARQRSHGVLPLRHAARAGGVRLRGSDRGCASASAMARGGRVTVGAATLVSALVDRRDVAGEQSVDGRPPGAHRYADPGRPMAHRAAASGAFRLRRRAGPTSGSTCTARAITSGSSIRGRSRSATPTAGRRIGW